MSKGNATNKPQYVVIKAIKTLSPAKKRRDQAWASDMLLRLKPFEVWVQGMSEAERAENERFCASHPRLAGGGLRDFYDWFARELLEVERDGSPTITLIMRELARRGGKASAAKATPEERSARARKAGLARQAKARLAKVRKTKGKPKKGGTK